MKKQRLTAISAIFAAALTALVLVIVILTGVAKVSASEIRSGREVYQSVRIEAGDSLWSICERYRTDDYATTAEYLQKVAHLNSIGTDAVIHAGNYLLVPQVIEE